VGISAKVKKKELMEFLIPQEAMVTTEMCMCLFYFFPSNHCTFLFFFSAGGDISESKKEKRVNGVLGTTRGLGNHGDVKLKKCVLVEPYTTSVPIDQYAQFLIIASHGVWEVFTPQEASSLLLKVCCFKLKCNIDLKKN
jgi:hypothetical protein